MRCEKFEVLWNDCLDQRISPQSNEELSAHAAICSKCAELMAGGELLNFAFPGLPQPTLSADFSDRVVASLQTPEPKAHTVENAPIPVAYEVFAQAVADSRRPSSKSKSEKRLSSTIIYWTSGVAAVIAVFATLAFTSPKSDAPNGVSGHNVAADVVNVAQPMRTVQPVRKPREAIVNVAATEKGTSASDYFPASSTIAVGSVFRRDHMSQAGFAVADGISPVTMSVSSALQSFQKSTPKEPSEPPRTMKTKRRRSE